MLARYPEARPWVHGLRLTLAADAEAFFYPFGAAVFHDVDREKRQEILDLELVLDTARDRRLVLLEAAIVALIVIELLLALLRVP